MKRKSYVFASFVLAGLIFIPQTAFSIYAGKSKKPEPEFSPTRLIVSLKPEADKKMVLGKIGEKVTTGIASLDSLNVRFKVKKQEKLFREFGQTALKVGKLSGVYVLEIPEGIDLRKMKQEYESKAEVEYVELDYKVGLLTEPNDSLFEHQWYLNNSGQTYLGVNRIWGDSNDTQIIKYGTEDADIDALEAFERSDDITPPLVGIIDTGVDLDHEDLAGNIWINPGEIPDNQIDDDHNGLVDDLFGWDFSGDSILIMEDNDPTDTHGHGTHCAGIVGATRNNAIGVSGINTPCRIMAIKVFPNAIISVCAKGITYAADMGCDVINMSWGSPYPSQLLDDVLDYAVSKDVLPIAAAGNTGGVDYIYPASCPQVFTVGASNSLDEVTYFSTYGEHVEVVAPGRDILSLRADSTDMYADPCPDCEQEPLVHVVDEKYYLSDGTSMSSPCAVGVVAYVLSASPGISKAKLVEIMEQSADDIIYPYGGDSLYSPGKDIYSGFGRVNLNSALQLLSGRLAKISYPYKNAIVSGRVRIIGTAGGANFQEYTLEYGRGYSPASWTRIATSTTPVTNDTLGIWDSFGPSGPYVGPYTIRLSVGEENQATVHVIAGGDGYVKITSPADGDTVVGYAQIRGFNVIPDFSHYTLECGPGESPTGWDTIAASTKMVAGEILGDWSVSLLKEDDYTLRLNAYANTGQIYSDSVRLRVKGIACGSWTRDLQNWCSASPAIGDVDGDGYDEIVAGIYRGQTDEYTSGIEVFSHQGERELGWPKDTNYGMISSPALGDLDNDGIDDIAICSDSGVHAYRSASPDWFRKANTEMTSASCLPTPVIADLERDGELEVLTIGGTSGKKAGTVYAWRKDGQSVIPGNDGVFVQTGVTSPGEGFPCLAVADLDKDGVNEVIVGVANSDEGVYIWDIGGNPLLGPQDYPYVFTCVFGIAIANVDADDDLEIVVFGVNKECATLCAFKKDGTCVTGYPIIIEDLKTLNWMGNHPAVGDLDGDGTLEIVVSVWTYNEARIYGWHQDGTPLGSIGSDGLLACVKSPDGERKKEILSSLGNSIGEVLKEIGQMNREELAALRSDLDEDPIFASTAETFGSPVLADINGDGNVDIIVRAGYFLGNGYERVFAWDYEGKLIDGFPLYASSQITSYSFHPYSPVIADMDRDGKLDMVLGTCEPKLVCWEFDTDRNTVYANWYRSWPKYMHDKHNSGILDPNEYGLSDIVYLINYLFKGGPAPLPLERGDVNCSGRVTLSDIVYLINYLFKGGPPPCR